MTMIEYLDEDGVVARVVFAPADEAEAGIHPGEIGYRIVDTGQAVEPGASPTLDAVREAGRQRIDGAASRARGRYLSNGIGQEATYQIKLAEAIAYRNAGFPADASPWPYIAQEAALCGITPEACATRIHSNGMFWQYVIGPQIEAARVAGKDALSSLSDVYGIQTSVSAVIDVLDQI